MHVAAKNKICRCNKTDCNESECFNIKVKDVLEAISSIDNLLVKDSKDNLQRLKWNYSCKILDNDSIIKLLDYREALERVLNNLKHKINPVLCGSQIYGLFGVVHKFVGKFKHIITNEVDSSNKQSWALQNPNCVAFESWERALYAVCNTIEPVVEEVTPVVKFAYEVESSGEEISPLPIYDAIAEIWELTNKQVDVEIESDEVSIFSFELTRKLEECNIGYTFESTPNNCNIVNFYPTSEDRSCNLELDPISTINSCNLNLEGISKQHLCDIIYSATGKSIC